MKDIKCTLNVEFLSRRCKYIFRHMLGNAKIKIISIAYMSLHVLFNVIDNVRPLPCVKNHAHVICSHQPSWIKHWAAFIKYIRKAKRLWLAANYKLQNINKTQTSIFARSHLRTVQIWLAILFYFIKFCLKVFVYRHSCVFGSDFNCLYFAVIYSLSVCNLVKHSLYSLQKFVSCL